MKVRIKTWERMVEEFGYRGSGKYSIDISDDICFTKDMENHIPEDRVVIISNNTVNSEGEYSWEYDSYYCDFYISDEMIEEYLTDGKGEDLTNPEHPANQELLPELDLLVKVEQELEQEFKLKPLDEILEEENKPKSDEVSNLKQIKASNRDLIKHLKKPNGRIHYYKFTLNFGNEDYSVRYFLEFEDRPEFVHKWFMKSHSKRVYSELPEEMASDLIGKTCEIPCEEIIGRRIGKQFEKVIVSKDKLVRFFD